MISAAELASMQATAESSCPDTAIVQRNTPASSDIWGNAIDSWSTVISSLPVRVASPATAQFQRIAEQLGVIQAWKVSFSVTADVRAGDRLVIGSDTLKVHTLGSPQSFNTLQEAICTEVR